ncbi:MAG: Acyl-CoA dehydrogenase [Ilumatobacteraceae bacterium]|nr:Acyl-CoA dehydrogenase [Ilumatobacteraceae bacterium]
MDEGQIVEEARTWYRASWDPTLTVGEWFQRMYESGWGYPTWPERWGGKGLPTSMAKLVRAERRAVGALGPPSGIGPTLLAPMLFKHGTDEQCDRFLRGLAYRGDTTCQMLSEPDAGSDLAASRTAAVRDGEEWRITGTKVWTSNAAIVTYGMLLARTNWDVPKHRGLSFFLCPAQQPGVQPRPLKQMNGRAEFNLVHFDEAIVADADLLGGEGEGWPVTRTFLTYEKNSFNPAAHEGGPFGPVDLTMEAGELARRMADGTANPARGNRGVGRALTALVHDFDRADDPHVRQDMAVLHTRRAIMGYTNLRMRASSVPGLEGPISKLTVSDITRLQRDVGLGVQGAAGTLLGDDAPSAGFQEFALSSPATSIAGGTDQIQRNHLAEKVLGLPREPGSEQDRPFSQLPHGASTWG